MRLFALSSELTVCTWEHPDYTGPLRRDGSGQREMVVHSLMDAVAGARRAPGRPETGGVPSKPPATILPGLWVSGYLPRAMVERAQGRRPKNRPSEERGRLGPRAGIPKRKRPNCHSSPKGTLLPARVAHKREGDPKTPVRDGEGTKGPWRRGATPPCAESSPWACESSWSRRALISIRFLHSQLGTVRVRHHCFLAQRRPHARN